MSHCGLTAPATAGTQPFLLQAYQAEPPGSTCVVHGSLTYQRPWLAVCFTVHGAVADLLLPPPVPSPERQDGLWESTCFEVFFAPMQSPKYWEINVSPAGHWNTYRFDGYRQGMHVEPLLQVVQSGSACQAGEIFTMDFRMDLTPLLREHALTPGILECNPCCILLDRRQRKSYWARQHQPPRPDFHQRANFWLRLLRREGD